MSRKMGYPLKGKPLKVNLHFHRLSTIKPLAGNTGCKGLLIVREYEKNSIKECEQ